MHLYVLELDRDSMFPIKIMPTILFIGLFILAACSMTPEISTVPASATTIPKPTATALRTLPTPSAPGDAVVWRDLQLRMDKSEVTESFINEFGSQRLPSTGQKFLWVHLALENIGKDEVALPELENFSVLYAESEFKPIYGHRHGYADYSTLASPIFPGQKLDAWLRFDIPDTAELQDLWFVFLPGSAQVGVSPSSPNYPYSENKPTFVWKCAP